MIIFQRFFYLSGKELFGNPELKEFVTDIGDALEPLLSAGVINSLMERYAWICTTFERICYNNI